MAKCAGCSFDPASNNQNCLDDHPSDGLPAQCVATWVHDKHRALRHYIEASSGARAKFGGGAYIELFAGPGRALVRGSGKPVDGSPMLALKHTTAPFTKAILCEWDEKYVAALRARTARFGDRAVVVPGDCHRNVDEVIRSIPTRGLHLAFIDPFSLDQLRFATLARLAQERSIDFLIHVPSMDIVRNHALPQTRERLARAAGGEVDGVKAHEIMRSFVSTLRRNLRDIDEDSPALPIYNDHNGRLYHLILISRNKLAHKLWRSLLRTIRPQRTFDLGFAAPE
jgi:three-Cys-motif partner protein